MSNIFEILERVKLSGLALSVTDERLKVEPRENLTPELRALLVQNKAAIIDHLKIQAADADCAPHWRWRLVFSDGTAKICAFTPPADRNEVNEVYPSAVTAQKIPDSDD